MMMSSRWTDRLPILLVLVLLMAGPARAAGDDRARAAECQRRYELGLEHYRNKDYPAAIAEFEAAYRLKQMTRLLFNLGQAHRKLGHSQQALDYYESYLRLEPEMTAEERAEVQR